MAKPVVIFLGVFAAGEIPFPFIHTFKDANGAVIDITAWTTFVEFEGTGLGPGYGTGTVIITDASAGEVTYTWHEDDFQDAGKNEFLIWVEDGTNRLASDLVKYEVYDGPGPTPT